MAGKTERKTHHLEYLSVDGRIVLKWISGSGLNFFRLRIGTNGTLLGDTVITFRVP
jgi:hypothetical protein